MKIYSSGENTKALFEKLMLFFEDEFPMLKSLKKQKLFVVKDFCDPIIFSMKRIERYALSKMEPGTIVSMGKKSQEKGKFSTMIMLANTFQDSQGKTNIIATQVIGNLAIVYREMKLADIEEDAIPDLIERIVEKVSKTCDGQVYEISPKGEPPGSSYM